MSLPQEVSEVLEGKRRWVVLAADNRDVLPLLPAKSVAHSLNDPPYDATTHENARSLKDGGSDIPIDFDPLDGLAFLPELFRVSAGWVLAFCAVEQLGDYKRATLDAGGRWLRGGLWDRPDGTPQLSGDRPGQAAEGIAIMRGSLTRPAWNSGGKRGMWRCGVEREDRQHPTPKPLPLMLELVEDFTSPGDLVLDAFAGSGSTGVACLRLGRRFIGIEKSEAYASIARERLEAESQGLTLRAARAGQLPMFPGGTP